MTTQAEMRNLVWQACTAIRNEHRDVKKYIEYTAILLFFKFYDDLYETLPEDVRGLIPEYYRWHTLRALDPRGFQSATPQVLVRLREFFNEKKWDGEAKYAAIFENFQFDIKHDEVLARALANLDRINFAGLDYDQKGDVYEYLIAKMADAGVKGEFFTPRPIVDVIIDILSPDSSMKVWDPACGTGGFLTRAFDSMVADANSKTEPHSKERDALIKKLRTDSIFGSETESVSARLARMNMILHGDGHSSIVEFNSLDRQSYTHKKLEIRGKKEANPIPDIIKSGFNLVMGNPPYGGSQTVSDVGMQFKPWHKSAKPEANFLQVMLHALAPGGRLGVVLPEGVLFRREEQKIRERLLKDFHLEAVIGLFKGAFEFAEVKACILIIRRPRSSEKWKGTRDVWIAEARSFDEIAATSERLAEKAEDEAARLVPAKEIREKKLTLKPSKYLRIVPSEETRAIPLDQLFEAIHPAAGLDQMAVGDVRIHLKDGNAWHVEEISVPKVTTENDLLLRPVDNRLHPELLKFYLQAGPLARKIRAAKSVIDLPEHLALEVPVPDRDRQDQLLQRLRMQSNIATTIKAQMTNRYQREWIDDTMFAVEQDDLLATSFGPLVDDASTYLDPTDYPDTEWKVFGVTNDAGIRQSEVKLGKEFKPGRKYKRLVAEAIAYNPQRINVGSIGITAHSDEKSIISPYYPQFTCKPDLDRDFALLLIRSPYYRRLIEEAAVGAVRNELHFSVFTQIEVPIPKIERQREILKIVQKQIDYFAPAAQIAQRTQLSMDAIINGLFEKMRPEVAKNTISTKAA